MVLSALPGTSYLRPRRSLGRGSWSGALGQGQRWGASCALPAQPSPWLGLWAAERRAWVRAAIKTPPDHAQSAPQKETQASTQEEDAPRTPPRWFAGAARGASGKRSAACPSRPAHLRAPSATDLVRRPCWRPACAERGPGRCGARSAPRRASGGPGTPAGQGRGKRRLRRRSHPRPARPFWRPPRGAELPTGRVGASEDRPNGSSAQAASTCTAAPALQAAGGERGGRQPHPRAERSPAGRRCGRAQSCHWGALVRGEEAPSQPQLRRPPRENMAASERARQPAASPRRRTLAAAAALAPLRFRLGWAEERQPRARLRPSEGPSPPRLSGSRAPKAVACEGRAHPGPRRVPLRSASFRSCASGRLPAGGARGERCPGAALGVLLRAAESPAGAGRGTEPGRARALRARSKGAAGG